MVTAVRSAPASPGPVRGGKLSDMTSDWEERVVGFWSEADDAQPDSTLARMRALVEERPADDPAALFELASAFDYLGHEAEAIPLYRAALRNGLDGARRPQAVVQLASSLRNVGDAGAAVELLSRQDQEPVTGAAPAAFLALALHDQGRHDDALKVALRALAVTVPMYGRAITRYVEDL